MARTLSLLVLLVTYYPATAQTSGRMLIGMSAYSLTGQDGLEVDPVYRLAGGGALSFGLPGGFAIQPELRYTIQGGSLRASVTGTVAGAEAGIPVDATFDLTYLEIPVMLTYGFDLRRGYRVEFGAGPAVGIKVDTRFTLAAETGPEFDQGISGKGRISGIAGAADLFVPFRGERLLVGLRYWRSTTDHGISEAFTDGFDLRATGVTLLSGVMF